MGITDAGIYRSRRAKTGAPSKLCLGGNGRCPRCGGTPDSPPLLRVRVPCPVTLEKSKSEEQGGQPAREAHFSGPGEAAVTRMKCSSLCDLNPARWTIVVSRIPTKWSMILSRIVEWCAKKFPEIGRNGQRKFHKSAGKFAVNFALFRQNEVKQQRTAFAIDHFEGFPTPSSYQKRDRETVESFKSTTCGHGFTVSQLHRKCESVQRWATMERGVDMAARMRPEVNCRLRENAMKNEAVNDPGRRNFLRAVPAVAVGGLAIADGSLFAVRAAAEDAVNSGAAAFQVFSAQQIQDDIRALAASPGNNNLVQGKNFTVVLTTETAKSAKEFEWHEGRDHVLQILDGSTVYELGGTPKNAHSPKTGEWLAPESEGATTITLHKGDMLVIPRGAPHKRSTAATVTFTLISPQGT